LGETPVSTEPGKGALDHPAMPQDDDGTTALDLFVNRPKWIDLLITEITHPGIDGLALIRAVREIDPDVKVLVVSGQAVHETVRRRLDDDSIPFLAKPFHMKVLLDTVAKMLAA
jgi:DNA-binding NtrC family response regulator